MPTIGERMATLETQSKTAERRFDEASAQREKIAAGLEDLAGHVRTLAATVERLVTQTPLHHETNQAAIAQLAATLARLEPIVTTHEQERQQLRGAKKMLTWLGLPLAGALGWAADRVIELINRHLPPLP